MVKTKLFLISIIGISSVLMSCQSGQKKNAVVGNDSINIAAQDTEMVISDSIRFCESTYPYKGGLLIANFGTEQLNPLNNEGKGYILYYKDGVMSRIIPADGNLNGPKGMYEKDGYLFICDVNKIVVYNLNAPKSAPQTITLPKGEMFVNDLAAKGDTLFVSVTNTGNIYSLNIAEESALAKVKPQLWCKVPGPNGILVDGNSMYVVSYPADGTTKPENVIYYIADLSAPKVEKFNTEPGQYDGVALSPDKQTLYITNWNPAGVYSMDVTSKKIQPLEMKTKVTGAADMTLLDGKLYIPDLPNSRVIVLPITSR